MLLKTRSDIEIYREKTKRREKNMAAGITEKTIIPKELAEMIEKEVWRLYQKGIVVDRAITIGTSNAVNKWRRKNAAKSGG
ncbi:unnamed protein product [marine sediment metagenome]|uniref:Uncharacterized protein n=1 Tax=marine sediment metagenome TaxID=412755 RepID=X1NIM9_9ZZZZ